MDVVAPQATEAAQITSTPVGVATVGQPYTYAVTASGVPTPTFSLPTTPDGMTIDPTSGLVQWMPTAPGDYSVTVRAANGVEPPAEQSFTITVSPAPQAAQITSTPITVGVVGQPYTYSVTASGVPTPTFSLLTAPDGMTIEPTNGLVQWTPSASGDYSVTVHAANGAEPPAEQSFTIVVANKGADLYLPLIHR